MNVELLEMTRLGMDDEVHKLLRDGVDPNGADQYGNTAVHWAVMHSRLRVLKTLMSAGGSLTQPNHKGLTPLHFAAKGKAVLLELFISNAVPLSPQAEDGNTPLHFVRSLPCARVLVEAGADPSQKNAMEQTPAQLARELGRDEVADFLDSLPSIHAKESMTPRERIERLGDEWRVMDEGMIYFRDGDLSQEMVDVSGGGEAQITRAVLVANIPIFRFLKDEADWWNRGREERLAWEDLVEGSVEVFLGYPGTRAIFRWQWMLPSGDEDIPATREGSVMIFWEDGDLAGSAGLAGELLKAAPGKRGEGSGEGARGRGDSDVGDDDAAADDGEAEAKAMETALRLSRLPGLPSGLSVTSSMLSAGESYENETMRRSFGGYSVFDMLDDAVDDRPPLHVHLRHDFPLRAGTLQSFPVREEKPLCDQVIALLYCVVERARVL
eukprot:PLAT6243.1.p1 GENE.PLAT6243.1~~PLAT6243.1.p1  ORF type:complete len:447 (-),score=151.95 PLAT6243.1:90-1406(-)